MRRDELLDRARAIVSPVLANLGYDLVEIGLAFSHGRRTLRVFIDKPNGVNVEDCATASRAIGPALDEHDLSFGRYYLEVSSPGAERKLRTRDDFKRFVGRRAQVRFRDASTGVSQVKGTIEGFCDDVLELLRDEGEPIAIPFDAISGAHLCL